MGILWRDKCPYFLPYTALDFEVRGDVVPVREVDQEWDMQTS